MLKAVLGMEVGEQWAEVEECLCAGAAGCLSAPLLVNDLLGAFDFERGDNLDRTARLRIEPSPLLDPGFKSDHALALLPKLHYRIALDLPRRGRLTLALWAHWQGGGDWSSLLWLEPGGPALRVGPAGQLQLVGRGPAGASRSRFARGGLVANRWTHLLLSLQGRSARLHLNGVRDAVLRGLAPLDASSLHLGRSDAHNSTRASVDDLHAWNKVVQEPQRDLIDLQSALPAMDAVRLACRDCAYHEALRRCRGRYRLCSVQEVYAVGHQAAAANRWLGRGDSLWFYAGAAAEGGDARKVGLCCRQ